MQENTTQSKADLKKWIYFILFIGVIGLVVFLMMGSGGKERARELYQQASAKTKEAVRVAGQTGSPEDRANGDIASEALQKAEGALVENDFNTAIQESEKALFHANKVLANNSSVATESGQILIKEAIGDVTMQSQGPNFLPVTERQPVSYGSTLQIGTESAALLGYASLVELTLHAGTRVTLQERLDTSGEPTFMSLFLESGSISFKTTELEGLGKIFINTNGARCELLKNTEAAFELGSTGNDVTVTVGQGFVQVTSGSDSAAVSRNEMLVVRGGQPMASPQSIPLAPTPVTPENFSEYPVNQNGFATVSFQWSPVTEARAYDLEVGTDRLFTKIIRVKQGFAGISTTYQDLEEGTYYWRVTSLGSENTASLPTAGRQFEVGKQRQATSGSVDSTPPVLQITKTDVQGYLVIINGKSERDADVRVDGERAIMDEFTGNFSYVASKPGAGVYAITVSAQDRAGNSVSQTFQVQIKD